MSMPSATLSTQEVAALIHVTETTIKRWADEGKIPCLKTPGGHRKFLMRDIIEFSEKFAYPLTGTLPPPVTRSQLEQLEFAVHTRNYPKLSEIFLGEALQADRNGLYQLLLYLYKHQISFPQIADDVIRPAMIAMGSLWEKGDLEISQEHKATHAITEAMVRLAPELHRKHPNGLSAVLACVEGEFHDLGLRCLAYGLEAEGWKIHFIGANTPFDTLITFAKVMHPNLVCLSFTAVEPTPAFYAGVNAVGKFVASEGGTFIVGGFSSGGYGDVSIRCDHVAISTQDAISFARDRFHLKPGPKKKSSGSASPV